MKLPIILSLLLIASTGPALAKDCRTPHLPRGKEVRLPPGVQVQLPPGCKAPLRAGRTEARSQDRLRANEGFIDLGNGTQVRISGRVRAEFGVSR